MDITTLKKNENQLQPGAYWIKSGLTFNREREREGVQVEHARRPMDMAVERSGILKNSCIGMAFFRSGVVTRCELNPSTL